MRAILYCCAIKAGTHVPEYDTTSVGEEEHFEFRHITMAVTDWQLWLHVALLWSIVVPGGSHPLPFQLLSEVNDLIQFTGLHSSCPRLSEGSDILLPFRPFSLSRRMPSQVRSSNLRHLIHHPNCVFFSSCCPIGSCPLFGQTEVALAIHFR